MKIIALEEHRAAAAPVTQAALIPPGPAPPRPGSASRRAASPLRPVREIAAGGQGAMPWT